MKVLCKLIVVGVLFLASVCWGQSKTDQLAHAIADAEGFGVKHAIPTRYHNPGDIRVVDGYKFPGQKGVGKGGHIIFKNDDAGWAALRHQIDLIRSGRSKNYRMDMTINQIAHMYAARWRTWAKNVAKNLDVEPRTTLAEFFSDEPPQVEIAIDWHQIDSILGNGHD